MLNVSLRPQPAAIARASIRLVGELRARDWIAANGEVTVVGREALKRWSEGSTGTENARPR